MPMLARVGDQVLCLEHGVTAIASGSSIFRCDGKEVARVGDVTGCGAAITTGSSLWLLEGRPVARIGDKISHGGQIITGSNWTEIA